MSISMKEERTITSIIVNKNMDEKIAINNIVNIDMEEGRTSTKQCYIYKHKGGYNNIIMNIMDRNTK
jgi:hypothetical protein